MLKDIIEDLNQKQEIRKNLIQIKELIKEDRGKKELLDLLADNSIFIGFLQHEDPKIRKNAALILGRLEAKEALPALAEAYEGEETLFVRSAYLTAMQIFDCKEYLPMLRERYEQIQKMESSEGEKKHLREERRELEKILRKEEIYEPHPFCGFEEETEVILTTDRGFSQLTAEQIRGGRVAVSPSGVRVRTKDLPSLLRIRTFREILFPIRGVEPFAMDAEIAGKSLLQGSLMELLECHLEGGAPYYFRLQVLSPMDQGKKTDFIKKTAYILEEESGYRLVNSKDDYEIEIRLIQNKEGRFCAYLKFFTLPLRRFSYRKNALAVSIHPAQAALLLRLAKPYLKEDAAVLDPFCGVGTMLLEREQILPARTLYGTDIFGEAIRGARENTELAGVSASYIQRDFFDFTHRHRFDEILTNMPARGKKSKAEQDLFYARFFGKAQEHLEKDGTMILYSNENGFVKKQLRLHKNLELLREYCIRPREGCFLFIIGIKE